MFGHIVFDSILQYSCNLTYHSLQCPSFYCPLHQRSKCLESLDRLSRMEHSLEEASMLEASLVERLMLLTWSLCIDQRSQEHRSSFSFDHSEQALISPLEDGVSYPIFLKKQNLDVSIKSSTLTRKVWHCFQLLLPILRYLNGFLLALLTFGCHTLLVCMIHHLF